MSEKRKQTIKEILNGLNNALTAKENPDIVNQAQKNMENAFFQMCYYQSYQDKKDRTNIMQREYKKFKGIYLCYKDPKVALLSIEKGLITNKVQENILTHFLVSDNTAIFRRAGIYKNLNTFILKQKNNKTR